MSTSVSVSTAEPNVRYYSYTDLKNNHTLRGKVFRFAKGKDAYLIIVIDGSPMFGSDTVNLVLFVTDEGRVERKIPTDELFVLVPGDKVTITIAND